MERFDDLKAYGEIARRIPKIRESLSEAALYEQLAEECTELAQAALKKARKLRDENYTPKSMDEIDLNLLEELSDVWLVEAVLSIQPDIRAVYEKTVRWDDRVNGED